MSKIVNTIKKIATNKLISFLEENPSKEEKLDCLRKESNKIQNKLSKLKEPVKDYSKFDYLFQNSKYKTYKTNMQKYEVGKRECEDSLYELENQIKMIDSDLEYDNDRNRAKDLIELLKNASTIEEIASYTYYGESDIKSPNKYILAVISLLQDLNIIKNDKDINLIYDNLEIFKMNQKIEESNLETLIKSLKKRGIIIDDGFNQLIIMILNEKSMCTADNLMTSFPILKQLKEDKEVPKNIRIALEDLDSESNSKRTIHEVGCEIFLKEIFYRIKENSNV